MIGWEDERLVFPEGFVEGLSADLSFGGRREVHETKATCLGDTLEAEREGRRERKERLRSALAG